MPPFEASFAQPMPEKKRKPLVRIVDSQYKDMPVLGKENFEIFGKQADDICEAYAEVVKWLKMPYLEDDFTDHLERSAALDELDPVQRSLMMENKFRNNPVGIALLNMNNLKQYLSQAKPKLHIAFPDLKEERSKLRLASGKDERKQIMGGIEKKLKKVVEGVNRSIG